MSRICIIGYGRMGQTIESLASDLGCEVGYIVQSKEDWNEKEMKTCDVAIDFSLPSTAFDNISQCIKMGLPIVSGTTGWLNQLDDIQDLLKEYPSSSFMYGSNFSLGVNMFFLINKYTAKLMSATKLSVSMTEIHHIHKLDAPSGTAISLANDLIDNHKEKKEWINSETSELSVLGIKSIREPDVPGTHIIEYKDEVDEISISHKAKSRKGFASGAIMASKWLVGKTGYFTVQDYVQDLLRTHSV